MLRLAQSTVTALVYVVDLIFGLGISSDLPLLRRLTLAYHCLHRWRKEIYASTFATDDNIYDARYACVELSTSAPYFVSELIFV